MHSEIAQCSSDPSYRPLVRFRPPTRQFLKFARPRIVCEFACTQPIIAKLTHLFPKGVITFLDSDATFSLGLILVAFCYVHQSLGKEEVISGYIQKVAVVASCGCSSQSPRTTKTISECHFETVPKFQVTHDLRFGIGLNYPKKTFFTLSNGVRLS